MKLCTLLVVFISQFATAQHPRDLVSSNALVVLSIQEGDTVNAIIESISDQTGYGRLDDEGFINSYLSDFLKDSSAIDLTEEVLILLEPATLSPDAKPAGLFGPMPHLVLICKPKTDRVVEIQPSSSLKYSTMHDGWFVASAEDNWFPPQSNELAPILEKLPMGQVSSIVDYKSLWTQFGWLIQMSGGAMIGQMNKPEPNGVIAAETKRKTLYASKTFKDFMQWSSDVDSIATSYNIIQNKLNMKIDISMKNPKVISIDNTSLFDMASLLTDNAIQYALNKRLSRTLLNHDFTSTQDWIGYDGSINGFQVNLAQSMQAFADLQNGSVVAYGLDDESGLTVSILFETPDQDAFMGRVPTVMEELSRSLLEIHKLELTPAKDSSNTWNIKILPSDGYTKFIDSLKQAFFPINNQLRFGKLGSSKIATILGPPSWRPVSQSHSTPLSELIQSNSNINVEFAISLDAREIVSSMMDVTFSEGSEHEHGRFATSPSARLSVVVGRSQTGSVLNIQADLFGLAKVLSEILP